MENGKIVQKVEETTRLLAAQITYRSVNRRVHMKGCKGRWVGLRRNCDGQCVLVYFHALPKG